MIYTRVRSYEKGKMVAEWLYRTDNQVVALEKARRDYPEHERCILVAEYVDSSDEHWKEYVDVCRRCGVIY